MNFSKDEKYLLEQEDYTIAVCPVCEEPNVTPKSETLCVCSYCGRKFKYEN